MCRQLIDGQHTTPEMLAQQVKCGRSCFNAATAAQNILFIICHDTDDRAVAIDNTHQAEKALTAAGMQVNTHTYPGGHSVNYELLYRIINDFKMMK